MAEVYSLNQNAPLRPQTANERPAHPARSATIVVIALLVIGLLYWWSATRSEEPVDRQQQLRAEVAAILERTPSTATPEEINRITNVLSSTPSTATQTDRERMSSILENL